MTSGIGSILEEIEQFARTACSGNDAAHDARHVERVVTTARTIARSEPGADPFVTEAASWLHDIVQLPKGAGPPGEAARRSARAARDFLDNLGLEPGIVDRIASAVESHSFSGGLRPETTEAAIVQDADRLDALGAVGLARLWVTARVMGSDLYHPDDPLGTSRDLDDRRYGLDHIEKKLLALPDLMNTESGRVLAQRRADFVRQYRETFLAELRGTQ